MKKVEIGSGFEDSQHGQGGELPVLKTFFERFGFSGIYSNIDKHSGAAAWKLVFAYIAGLINNSQLAHEIG